MLDFIHSSTTFILQITNFMRKYYTFLMCSLSTPLLTSLLQACSVPQMEILISSLLYLLYDIVILFHYYIFFIYLTDIYLKCEFNLVTPISFTFKDSIPTGWNSTSAHESALT